MHLLQATAVLGIHSRKALTAGTSTKKKIRRIYQNTIQQEEQKQKKLQPASRHYPRLVIKPGPQPDFSLN